MYYTTLCSMQPKQLSELEQQVMSLVWERKELSVRDALGALQKDRKFAYTTVATILERLHKKGLVKKKQEGLAWIYTPKVSQSSYSKNVARSFVDKFFSSFGDTAIASFAETIETLPKEKKQYLLKLLDEHEQNK